MQARNWMSEINGVAGYMSTDSDHWIIRRFERLHLINILAIQQRMLGLERDIDDTIKYERSQARGQPCKPPEKSQEIILEELQATVKAYDKAILSLDSIKNAGSPAPHVVKSLNEFAQSERHSTLITSLRPLPTQPDTTSHLLSVTTGARSWFHDYVGRHERLSRVFQEPQEGGHRKHFAKFSETKLRNTEFGIVAFCLCLVQLLPVLALTLVNSKAVRLAVIIVLIVLVSLLNALFANTVRATNFGAIAAYSAIVVVFISQSS